MYNFLSRTLPSSALLRVPGHVHDTPSPLNDGPPTPAYLTVSSPQDQGAGASPQEGMSPTTQLVHKTVLIDRAQLLLNGRDRDLMKQMSRDERRCAMSDHPIRLAVCVANFVWFRATADWLHDFWMFSFITTKYWGKGPKNWTLPLIKFKTLAGVVDDSTGYQPSGSQELGLTQSNSVATGVIDPPTQLCNWSIHMKSVDYEPIESRPGSPESNNGDQFDVEDESTWREWNDEPV